VRPLNEIIVHCAATRPDWMQGRPIGEKVEAIRRWHTDPKPKGNGWNNIGYHYVIDRDGAVATGRPLAQVGAHVMGRNTGTIGICLLGGFGSNERDRFEQHFTTAQDRALRKLIAELMKAHGKMAVTGHNQFAAKACPGFHAPTWYASAPAQPVDYVKPEPAEVPVTAKSPWAILVAIVGVIAGLLFRKGKKK
jgi:N-acetyl-anhydromuramyl-L-alanine amidase AmpD